jgi:hypothetical protein
MKTFPLNDANPSDLERTAQPPPTDSDCASLLDTGNTTQIDDDLPRKLSEYIFWLCINALIRHIAAQVHCSSCTCDIAPEPKTEKPTNANHAERWYMVSKGLQVGVFEGW